MDFDLSERASFAAILELAVREDLGRAGDMTSRATIPATLTGRAAFVARTAGTLAGIPAIARTFERIDPAVKTEALLHDGQQLAPGYWVATVEGPMLSILAAERITLNFLQRLSGIATITRQFVDATAGTKAKILDTRKTIPGWRALDKYAVRQGGGFNHRGGLFDAYLIKDNHLAAIRKAQGANDIENAIQRCRELNPGLPVEVEVDSLQQLERALACRPEIVLLDNMNPQQLRTAIDRRDAIAPATLLEASGGIRLDTIRAIAETGVDRISVGALTHSAPALDIALDFVDGN